jgi:hypothetical protein
MKDEEIDRLRRRCEWLAAEVRRLREMVEAVQVAQQRTYECWIYAHSHAAALEQIDERYTIPMGGDDGSSDMVS